MHEEPERQSWMKFARGDADIWRQFIGRQIPLLYRFFLKKWPNSSLAEELVQKTVFDAVRGCGGFNPDKGSPEEWIHGIARNIIRLEIRKRAGRPGVNGDFRRYFDEVDTRLMPDEMLERRETAEIVRSALGKLELKEQTVLRAMYIEDLAVRDIARKMKMTEKAVHSLLYRARISLRRQLKQLTLENTQRLES